MLTLADTKRLPDIYEAEIRRIEMDYDVQMAEALADWRAYIEKKNDARLDRGLVRPARRRFSAGNFMLAVGGVFLASVIAGVLLDPADGARFVGASV